MLSRKICRVTMSALAAANVSRTETNLRPIIETNFSSRIELNGFILQIQFDNNILWNSSHPPHPNYSGRRYRWNQMKKGKSTE